MATILSTLYPPLIDTFMPAFSYEGPAPITFSFSPYNSINDIKKIHVSLVNQKTNQSAFKTTYLNPEENLYIYDNIWIIPITTDNAEYYTIDRKNNICVIRIPSKILKTDNSNFVTNNYYKVQIRLDNYNADILDSSYLQKREYFSEWSSVCLIKAISKPILTMIGFDDEISENVISKVRKVQAGTVPIAGNLDFVNNDKTETLQRFKASIISDSTDEVLDETKDWIYTTNNINPNRIYWLANLTNVEPDTDCTLKIEIFTKNQFYLKKEYQIKIANFDPINFNPDITFKKIKLDNYESTEEKIVTEEDGMVEISITAEEELPQGFLYITRATSLDNYKNWELLSCTENNGKINKTIIDPTVGSLVTYKYACQYRLKKNRNWTQVYQSKEVYPDFYDMLIYRNGKQIALRYNTQITGYSSVVNRQVINTLGSKYPKFAENAHMNYKKFTISGLITSESDFNRKFLNDRDFALEMNDYDEYMNGKYEVRNDTLADGTFTYLNNIIQNKDTYEATKHLTTTAHDLAPKDNWWFERKFREEALAWLNDGEPKLLRSMTEGNLIVMLTDISLTPNTQLGRRTYNISMTAYEVGDGYSLDTLSSLGIITIPNDYQDYVNAGKSFNEIDEYNEEEDGIIEETTICQIYEKKAADHSLIASRVGRLTERSSIDEYSLDDQYNGLYYQGINSNYKVVKNSYRLKDLKIEFITPPQWYDIANPDNITLQKDNKKDNYFLNESTYKDSNKNDLIYGYKFKLYIYGDEKPKTIFIGEKGFYQVPSNLIVEDIVLYDDAIATLDFKLTYKRQYDESSVPTESEIAQKIVGQLFGKWFPGQSFASTIKNKYEYYNIEEGKGYGGLIEKQYLDKITAFGFDGTTYTVLKILFENEKISREYLVGRTGVYNLMTDYPIDEVTLLGRRMFRKDNSDYVSHNTYPYIIDKSAEAYQGTPTKSFNWEDFDLEQETDVPVIINGNFSNPEVNQIIKTWIDETNRPYDKIKDVINPVANTIYGFYSNNLNLNDENIDVTLNENNNQDIILLLYTSSGSWVQVDFINEDNHIIMSEMYNTDSVNTNKKKIFLEDWEFSLDNSADRNYKPEILTWYKSFLGNTNIEVIARDFNVFNFISNIKNKIDIIPELDGYLSTDDIKDPEYNIVYGFYDGENKPKKYKIYYIDHNWYDVEELNQEWSLILAKVPVNGMINYRGNLVRIKYE